MDDLGRYWREKGNGKEEMISISNKRIIGIDHGYGFTKTANTIIRSSVRTYSSEPTFAYDTLKYEGRWIKTGEKRKIFVQNKTVDDDYYALTLEAVANELEKERIDKADIHIACGLPTAWTGAQREEFRRYIMKKEEVNFEFHGTEHEVRFSGCHIFPQTYPAIIKDIQSYTGINLLVDIGSETINILYINNKQPQLQRCWTERLGIDRCIAKAQNDVMKYHGVLMDTAGIEQVLWSDGTEFEKKYEDTIGTVAKEYIRQVFETLRKYEYAPNLVRLHIVGGGARVIKKFGGCDPAQVEIIDDIHANAKGYEYLSERLLKNET